MIHYTNKDINIPISPSKAFYLIKAKKPTLDCNVKVRSRMPQKSACFFSRCIHHKLFLNEYFTKSDSESKIVIGTPFEKNLVQITLEENESMAIDLRYLIGFSASVKLKLNINFSMSSYAVRKNCITIAKGPGILLLETNGQPTVLTSELFGTQENTHQSGKFSSVRLIAWTPSIHFQFDSIYSWIDIYCNDIRIQCQPDQKEYALLDADISDSVVKTNWFIRLLRDCYWPF